jgi:uncharacterized membrane protein
MTDESTSTRAPVGAAEGDEDAEFPLGQAGLISPGRVFALADGIFAISMTLLALDVRVPEEVTHAVEFNDHAGAFFGKFGIFVLAFLIAARFWMVNHTMMAPLRKVDAGLLNRLVSYLLGICSLPVATTLLFRFGSQPRAVSFAALVLSGTSLLASRLWWYLSDPQRGLSQVDRVRRVETMIRALYSTAVFALAVPVAYLLRHSSVDDHSSSWATLVWLLLLLDQRFMQLVRRFRPAW